MTSPIEMAGYPYTTAAACATYHTACDTFIFCVMDVCSYFYMIDRCFPCYEIVHRSMSEPFGTEYHKCALHAYLAYRPVCHVFLCILSYFLLSTCLYRVCREYVCQ